MRLVALVWVAFCLSALTASAGTYEYHPGSVLKLGGTFDPQNLTIAYPSCIVYDREYAVHRLDRKQPEAEIDARRRARIAAERPQAPARDAQGRPTPPAVAPVPVAKPNPGAKPDNQASSDDVGNVAAENELSIEQIKTREHLYKFLNISTSISGQYKFFSANASLTYESEETFDADSFVFGVRGMTTFAELGLIDPRLSDDSRALLSNREAFYSRCGREWVSQESRGVLIAVVYTIKNVSQSQRSRLEAAVSGGFNGAVLKVNVEAKLKQIFESVFVSNYYSAKVHAVGGHGVSGFATTVTDIDDPVKVLKAISEYMKTLSYENSVPLRFTTGSLHQFIAQEQPTVEFDTFNRRIADLFLSYEDYRSQRLKIWRFLNDDTQSGWDGSVDRGAWARLGLLDETIGAIEAKAQVCRKVAAIAVDFSAVRSRGRNVAPTPPDKRKTDFIRDFSIGISGRLSTASSPAEYGAIISSFKTEAVALAAPAAGPPPANSTPCDPRAGRSDEVDAARTALCECLRRDDSVFIKSRYSVSSTPHVSVIHDKTLSPRTILYVSVTSAAKLSSAILMRNDGQPVLNLRGGYDPDSGPVWFGSVLFRDGSGAPPPADKLPYYVEIKDSVGRVYTKPIVPID